MMSRVAEQKRVMASGSGAGFSVMLITVTTLSKPFQASLQLLKPLGHLCPMDIVPHSDSETRPCQSRLLLQLGNKKRK